MDRRQFLASLGIGAPAAVLAAKTGLFERVRSYFFAPRGGWLSSDDGFYSQMAELWAARPDCRITLWGMSPFSVGDEVSIYGTDGALSDSERLLITGIDSQRNLIHFETLPVSHGIPLHRRRVGEEWLNLARH